MPRSLIVALATTVACAVLSACERHVPATPAASAFSEPITQSSVPASTESATCADEDIECEERIYQLEETLFAYEAGVSKGLATEAQACWKTDVDAFRRSVEGCDNMACKESALLARIASLHDLQPSEHRAALGWMPYAPALIALLAPSPEASGSPAETHSVFEARGSLIRAVSHPEHMGVAVHADGKDHVFIFEMDMGNGSGQDEVLGLVGTSPTTKVLVRGIRQSPPSGIDNFDPSQCRWVYQLP